jgi:hypothetical protein
MAAYTCSILSLGLLDIGCKISWQPLIITTTGGEKLQPQQMVVQGIIVFGIITLCIKNAIL